MSGADCYFKKTFKTKAEAVAAARAHWKISKPLRAYRCPHCKGFHLTHSKEREGRNARTD